MGDRKKELALLGAKLCGYEHLGPDATVHRLVTQNADYILESAYYAPCSLFLIKVAQCGPGKPWNPCEDLNQAFLCVANAHASGKYDLTWVDGACEFARMSYKTPQEFALALMETLESAVEEKTNER